VTGIGFLGVGNATHAIERIRVEFPKVSLHPGLISENGKAGDRGPVTRAKANTQNLRPDTAGNFRRTVAFARVALCASLRFSTRFRGKGG
jgi:hypothetical protein